MAVCCLPSPCSHMNIPSRWLLERSLLICSLRVATAFLLLYVLALLKQEGREMAIILGYVNGWKSRGELNPERDHLPHFEL